MKSCAVLGATGSIGKSTLQLASDHPGLIKIEVLSAHRDRIGLLDAIEKHLPTRAYLTGSSWEDEDRERAKASNCILEDDPQALKESLASGVAEVVIMGIAGAAGLEYGLSALESGARLAMANKEPLVIAGHCFQEAAQSHGGEIIPVDSEHSAIFQCLLGSNEDHVERIILTSSGGPFHGRSSDFASIKIEEALKHPTWSMGSKITVDSATMMNKALEMIEARWLFNLPLDKVEVSVHRQSIVHSMVEFIDGSVMAQLGVTDMQYPILYAITHPERFASSLPRLRFDEVLNLSFEPVNPFLQQAIDLARAHGEDPVRTIYLNGANEVYVQAFLEGKVGFDGIYAHLEAVVAESGSRSSAPNKVSDVLEYDQHARMISQKLLGV
jgi:1-deoxy-D-xylulose-5-phosphate reductoisomerase